MPPNHARLFPHDGPACAQPRDASARRYHRAEPKRKHDEANPQRRGHPLAACGKEATASQGARERALSFVCPAQRLMPTRSGFRVSGICFGSENSGAPVAPPPSRSDRRSGGAHRADRALIVQEIDPVILRQFLPALLPVITPAQHCLIVYRRLRAVCVRQHPAAFNMRVNTTSGSRAAGV